MKQKIIIYQVLPRLYGNRNTTRKENGSIEENGSGKMNDFTSTVLKKIREKGITHVWYTGIIRHATQTDYKAFGIPRQHPAVVKGKAGSPYAIADYYDVDPDLAVNVEERMDEFEKLLSRTHRAGLKFIIDFVPNHVARQYKSVCKPKGVKDLGANDNTELGFDPQNNFYYCPGQSLVPYFDLYHGEKQPYEETPAKATGNDHFDNAPGQNDWYETVKLNYGVDYYAGRIGHFDPTPSTWKKMLHILLFWAGKGVDAFRCDMAEMVPAEFWAWATKQVKDKYPEIVFIGEVYNPNEYRRYLESGFDYLYDKVGMYDTMRDVICHHRDSSAITQAWQACDDIRNHMLYFLENHDEHRIASDFFAGSGRKAMPALIANALMQQNPFMVYAGQEYGERGMDKEGFSGQDGKTTIFDYWSIDTLCRADANQLTAEEQQLADVYSKVLNFARKEKAIGEGEMFDLMYVNQQYQRQYAFLRKAGKEIVLVVVNFDDAPVQMDLNLPAHAFDCMDIKEKVYTATELFSGASFQLELQKDTVLELHMAPYDGIVCKIK
ncbi:MAG: alpha-glucosidase C-terminal domain-containing protein [Prevotella sp.]|jgi:glycosidase|nr:alpha-glucosidase C-terminal domain-containing protein [Prevotella sp.]